MNPLPFFAVIAAGLTIELAALDPNAREQIRAAQDDDYEASTPGADRWRERLDDSRYGWKDAQRQAARGDHRDEITRMEMVGWAAGLCLLGAAGFIAYQFGRWLWRVFLA